MEVIRQDALPARRESFEDSVHDEIPSLVSTKPKLRFKAGKPPFNAPPEIHTSMERATAELLASGQAGSAVKAGDRAPKLLLKDQHGNEVSSVGLRAKGPLVVTVYRGVWCPCCNLELSVINEVLPKIQSLGANVVANTRETVLDNQLSFPVLSDVQNQTEAAFGLRFNLPDQFVEFYKWLRHDLRAFNVDASWTQPMPARYLIRENCVVLYSEVNSD